MSKYIAGVITDTHLDKTNFDTQISIFSQSINICKELNIPLYHAGDFLEERGIFQEFDVKNNFERLLGLFVSENFGLTGIVGNHDKVLYTKKENWLSQFRYHPNFNLIESVGFDDIGDFRIHLVSYFLETDNYVDYLNKAKNNIDPHKTNVLITHVSVSGVKNNDGSKVENNLKKSDFNDFDLVLIGHYHNSQDLGKIKYIGSTHPKNFGEDNNKGITLIKSDGTVEHRVLKFKEFKKVKVNIDDVDLIELNALKDKYKDSDQNIQFELTGSESKIKSIDRSEFTKAGIKLKTKYKEIEQDVEYADESEIVEYNNETINEAFQEFCNVENLDYNSGIKYLNQKLGK